jgi:hypothetical protein
MNCLDCQPDEVAAVAVCGRCGAGLCAEHLIETDEYLTFRMPINMPVEASPPARKLRCARCAAAEQGQQRHRRREHGLSQR